MSCGGSHLGFPIGIKNKNFVEDLPMIIPGQFGFNCPSGFREEPFSTLSPIGSNVKLSSAVAAILNFIPEQKTFSSNAFFSETTNMIKGKLYMNVHWIVLYNL
jgi:hypothetical protein